MARRSGSMGRDSSSLVDCIHLRARISFLSFRLAVTPSLSTQWTQWKCLPTWCRDDFLPLLDLSHVAEPRYLISSKSWPLRPTSSCNSRNTVLIRQFASWISRPPLTGPQVQLVLLWTRSTHFPRVTIATPVGL